MDTTKSDNALVFFISDISELDHIDKVLDKTTEVSDICITSDKDISTTLYAHISPFYLKFGNRANIVFFNMQSYLEYREILSPDRIILAISSQEYLSNNIDPRTLNIKQIIEL